MPFYSSLVCCQFSYICTIYDGCLLPFAAVQRPVKGCSLETLANFSTCNSSGQYCVVVVIGVGVLVTLLFCLFGLSFFVSKKVTDQAGVRTHDL